MAITVGSGRVTPGVVRGDLTDPSFVALYSERMFRLRYDVFHLRLHWDVVVENGREQDQFDDGNSVYMLATNESSDVTGGWRLRRTTGRYMLRDVFPQLLHGLAAPADRCIWEISRFAVDTQTKANTAGFSLGDVARRLLLDAVQFAIQHQINQYVLVISVAVERLVASSGVVLHRFGPPIRIGRVLSVACWVDIDAHTRHVLLGKPLPQKAAA